MRVGRIESKHSIKSLEGMVSRSHDLGAELEMHYLTVDCYAHSNEEKVAVVVPVTSVEASVTVYDAMLALTFSTLSLDCLMKRFGKSAQDKMDGNIVGGSLFERVLTICFSSLQEDVRAILSV